MTLSRVTVIMVAVIAVAEATVVEVDGAAVVVGATKTKWEAWAVVLGQSIGEPKNSSVSRRISTWRTSEYQP